MRTTLCAVVVFFFSISPSLADDHAQDIFDALKIEANLWEATAAVAHHAATGDDAALADLQDDLDVGAASIAQLKARDTGDHAEALAHIEADWQAFTVLSRKAIDAADDAGVLGELWALAELIDDRIDTLAEAMLGS